MIYTEDLPMKVERDVLDFGSEGSGGAGLANSSVDSFFLPLLPIENLVIFLSVFLSILPVFSWGDVLPDLSAVFALELAVPEVKSRLDTDTAAAPPFPENENLVNFTIILNRIIILV